MRILGQCPAGCGQEDEFDLLSPPRGGIIKVRCRDCLWEWPSVPDAVVEAAKRGRRLVPVSIERDPHRVIVTQPLKADIPCVDLVVRALNETLRVACGLGWCYAIEGGIAGMYEGESIELRNMDMGEWIGLEDEHRLADASGNPQDSERCREVLDQYELLLHMLFGDEELLVGKERTRGAILKLAPEDPYRKDKVKLYLQCAIRQSSGGEVFAGVLERNPWLRVSRSALAGLYAAGVSEAEIAEQFWLREPVAQESQ